MVADGAVVTEKSPAFAPEIETYGLLPVRLRAALPVF